VTSAPLPGLPSGLLVTQDGYNVTPSQNQNFKFVSWRDVAAKLGLRE
jgi:3-phytase